MESSFWLQRWEDNQIGFHKGEVNPLLIQYFDRLSLAQGSRVFVPLCGKTLDIGWLLSKGYRVAGVELSELAIEQLFIELEVEPYVSELGPFKQYSADNIDIFVGDVFALSATVLGAVDAVYDRAALVALPKAMRDRYAARLKEITNQAPQLLLCFEYDQTVMDGPPFSIPDKEVTRLYADSYDLNLLVSTEIEGGLKGQCAATEHAWLLRSARRVNHS